MDVSGGYEGCPRFSAVSAALSHTPYSTGHCGATRKHHLSIRVRWVRLRAVEKCPRVPDVSDALHPYSTGHCGATRKHHLRHLRGSVRASLPCPML